MCIFRRNKKATESVASTLNRRRITITNRLNSYINLWEPRYLFDMEFKTEENNARINRTNEDTIEKLKASYQKIKFLSCSNNDGVILDKIEKELDVIDKYYRNEASLTIINDSANDIWKCVQSWDNR